MSSFWSNADAVFSFAVFSYRFVGTRIQLPKGIFAISKRLIEFDLFGIY